MSQRLIVIDLVAVWLATFFLSTALMYQLRMSVGGLVIEILSPSVSRFAYHLPGTVPRTIAFDEYDELPGRR